MDVFKIFRIAAAAENLLKLFDWARKDGRLSHEEIVILVSHGLVPLMKAFGREVPADLPEIESLPPNAQQLVEFSNL